MTNEEFAFGQWKEDAGNTLTRTALRAMYDKTQAELEAAGIKELTVFRGIYLKPIDIDSSGLAEAYDGDKKIKLKDSNTLESWSLSRSIANTFAEPLGVTLGMTIPASRVVSMPSTGFGCLAEREIVILSKDGDVAKIERLTKPSA